MSELEVLNELLLLDKVLNTTNWYYQKLKHSFHNYSNGGIEGTDTIIKVIKRTSLAYRSYEKLDNRYYELEILSYGWNTIKKITTF